MYVPIKMLIRVDAIVTHWQAMLVSTWTLTGMEVRGSSRNSDLCRPGSGLTWPAHNEGYNSEYRIQNATPYWNWER